MNLRKMHFGLLVAGAIAVILWLLYEKNAQAAALDSVGGKTGAMPGIGIASNAYPNVPQIQPQNFDVSGFAANALPNVATDGYQLPTYTIANPSQSATPGGGCSCEEDSCDSAGQPVSSQLIPAWVINQGGTQLKNFSYKLSS